MPDVLTSASRTIKPGAPPEQDEKYFLEGPRSRIKEFAFTWRTMWEFIRGFRLFHFVPPCIAVFGSARVQPGSRYYNAAREMGGHIAGLGFAVMTGGGPGIMEAASLGAKEHNGRAIGCNIVLPKEQRSNVWLDTQFNCRYFFVRKVLMFKYSYGFVIMPGGIGTMDEFFEALTLIQTKKILDFPVILFGSDYWKPIITMLHTMLEENMIDVHDLDYLKITDSPEEAVRHLEKFALLKYNARRRQIFRRSRILGE